MSFLLFLELCKSFEKEQNQIEFSQDALYRKEKQAEYYSFYVPKENQNYFIPVKFTYDNEKIKWEIEMEEIEEKHFPYLQETKEEIQKIYDKLAV